MRAARIVAIRQEPCRADELRCPQLPPGNRPLNNSPSDSGGRRQRVKKEKGNAKEEKYIYKTRRSGREAQHKTAGASDCCLNLVRPAVLLSSNNIYTHK